MQRVIELEGGVNFRDFGGYPTTHGGRVVTGSLFRSGMMAKLTDDDRARVNDLEIAVICDLRRPDERDNEPTALPDDAPERVLIPMDPGSGIALRAALKKNTASVSDRVEFMIGINRELAADHIDDYRRMFEVLLESRAGGFLVHCSAGKDRTGFAAAIIQAALGVPLEHIERDYLFTNEAIDFENFILPRLRARYGHRAATLEEAKAVSGVRVEYIQAALQTVDETFGSIDGYLRDAMHLDDASFDELRGRYVTRS